MKNKILVIAGPTAVGKTNLSLKLAQQLNGEIVSADSMQIYTGLDIGTAKPTKDEMGIVAHHMIDICHPSERFSVAQYVKLADSVISDIFSRGKTPIVVGGTGLYIDNLVYDNDFGELGIDMRIRSELYKKTEIMGGEKMLLELQGIDPQYASKLHSNDIKRIVHALEIYYSTGKTQTEIIANSRTRPPRYPFLYSVLTNSSRANLYERIDNRVDVMLKSGLLDEAEWVINSGWYSNSTASQAIGYKEFEPYFKGNSDLEVCISVLKQHSRNYAKRQLTWFRHRPEADFIFMDENADHVSYIIEKFEAV